MSCDVKTTVAIPAAGSFFAYSIPSAVLNISAAVSAVFVEFRIWI